MQQAILQACQALYEQAPRSDRLHVAVRLALCPFAELATFVPMQGLILDLGCGHGVFAHALALESGQRHVVGVEPSSLKLAAARLARRRGGPAQFAQGDALANPVPGPCRAILLIDVLYLLTRQQQVEVLRACYERLSPGGVLLVKTMDDRPRWKAALNRVEEGLVVHLLHITLSKEARLTFRPLAEWQALCQEIGFTARAVRLDRGYYHPHGAVIGVRP